MTVPQPIAEWEDANAVVVTWAAATSTRFVPRRPPTWSRMSVGLRMVRGLLQAALGFLRSPPNPRLRSVHQRGVEVAVSDEAQRDALLGRDADFSEFFHAAWPRLFRTALAIAGDRGLAEDALQSAFIKAYSSWHRVRAADRPEAYVRRMVVNEVLGWRRHGWWHRERPHERVEPGKIASPDGGVVQRLTLWEAVHALPVRQRAVVVLRYYEDLTEVQIAEVLGCSRGTVKSQASAALATLRRNSGLELDALGEGATR